MLVYYIYRFLVSLNIKYFMRDFNESLGVILLEPLNHFESSVLQRSQINIEIFFYGLSRNEAEFKTLEQKYFQLVLEKPINSNSRLYYYNWQ